MQKTLNRDDIIRMAREAGWYEAQPHDDCPACGVFDLYRFANLVAVAEREACAKVCEKDAELLRVGTPPQIALMEAAAAIRARGQG